MNKKTLLVVVVLLVAGAVVAVVITRSPGESERDEAHDEDRGSHTGSVAGRPSTTPGADPGAPPGPGTAPAARPPAARRAETPALTDDQKDRIVKLCRQAGTAYVAAEHQKAQRLANQALDMDPNNQFALRIAGASACALKMQSNAQAVYNRMDPTSSARNLLVNVCARKGITLATGPKPPTAAAPSAAPGTGPSSTGFEGADKKPEGAPKKLSSTAVTSTIRKVRKQIVGCMKDHKGLVRVRMTVEGSGKVAAAAALGDHAGTQVGACVKETVLKMTFPSFTGPPRTFIFPFINK